jgi:serine O-acetyltransferase
MSRHKDNLLCVIRDDIRAIFRNDPAARNLAEVLLYPGLHAILLHRLAHALWRRRVPFIPRLISQISRFLTGIEIHPAQSSVAASSSTTAWAW